MLILGQKEFESGNVSVRRHKFGDIGTFAFDEYLNILLEEIREYKIPPKVNQK
jgi:threonyl-tRNA synthetase